MRVNRVLATSDRMEHLMARIGAEMTLQVSGDWAMFESLLTSRPPGETHILPEWAVTQARNVSKVEHQQRAWLSGEVVTDDGIAGGGGARRRAAAKGKAKGGADKAKGDGQGKGKSQPPRGGAQGT